ncbi:MAG: hypothetical protein Q9227_005079 [Pyrenula ochraceoflavens]
MTSPPADTRYTFVECDGQKKQKHRKEAQSHVMREYMRKRRLKEVQQFQNQAPQPSESVQTSPARSAPRPLPDLKPLLRNASKDLPAESSKPVPEAKPPASSKDPPKAKWGRPALSSRSKRLAEGQDNSQQKPQHIAPKPLAIKPAGSPSSTRIYPVRSSPALSTISSPSTASSSTLVDDASTVSLEETMTELVRKPKSPPKRFSPLSSTLRASLSAMGLYSPPQDSLSTFRRDAFSCYPIAMTDREALLVDYWMASSNDIFRVNELTQSKSLFKMKDLMFPAAMSSPAAFEMLVLLPAALHRSHKDAMFLDGPVRRARAVLQVNSIIDHLVNKSTLSGDDWLAIMAVIAMERLHGDQKAAQVFGQLLWEIALWKYERSMQWLMEERTFTCYAWINALWCFDPDPLAPNRKYEDNMLMTEASYVWTLKILRDALKLTMQEVQFAMQGHVTRRHTTFSHGTGLHRILSPVGLTEAELGLKEYRRRSVLRANVLLLIHLAFLHSSQSGVNRDEEFLVSLESSFVALDIANSPDPLLLLFWAMLNLPRAADSYAGVHAHAHIARITTPASSFAWPPMTHTSNLLFAWLSLDRGRDGTFFVPTVDAETVALDLGYDLGEAGLTSPIG